LGAGDGDLLPDHRIGQGGLAGVGATDEAREAGAERFAGLLAHSCTDPITSPRPVACHTTGQCRSARICRSVSDSWSSPATATASAPCAPDDSAIATTTSTADSDRCGVDTDAPA